MKTRKLFRLAATGSILVGLTAGGVVVATPASAVPGLTFVTAVSPLDSASSKEALATCPSGSRVLGGGGYIQGGGRQVHLTRLQALGSSDRFAAGAEENGAYAGSWRVYAYGICARAPAGLEYVTFQSPRDSNAYKQVHAKCSPGKRVVSAGARIYGGNGDVVLLRFQPGLDQVEVEAVEDEDGHSGDWMVWAHGVCADPLAGWELVSGATPTNSSDKVNSVGCPAGKRLHGFGSAMNGESQADWGEAIHAGAYPDAGLTTATTVVLEDVTGIANSWFTSIVAICAT
jgi:hypothetical protein